MRPTCCYHRRGSKWSGTIDKGVLRIFFSILLIVVQQHCFPFSTPKKTSVFLFFENVPPRSWVSVRKAFIVLLVVQMGFDKKKKENVVQRFVCFVYYESYPAIIVRNVAPKLRVRSYGGVHLSKNERKLVVHKCL